MCSTTNSLLIIDKKLWRSNNAGTKEKLQAHNYYIETNGKRQPRLPRYSYILFVFNFSNVIKRIKCLSLVSVALASNFGLNRVVCQRELRALF